MIGPRNRDNVVGSLITNHRHTVKLNANSDMTDTSKCHSDDTLKAVSPFYLVSVPGEVKDPIRAVNV